MNSVASSNERTIQPTLIGLIETEQDKNLLIEACLSGKLNHISRFPQQDEIRALVRSGNIFVYANPPTGPGHWDDGMEWRLRRSEDGLRIEREHFGPDAFIKTSGTIIHQQVLHYFVSYYQMTATANLRRVSEMDFIRS